MLDNTEKYNYVKNILVERMSKYRRDSFKLERLYEIIQDTTDQEAYITFTYDEFYNMFKKEVINGAIPYRKFSIVKEGFLDKKCRYPFAHIHVDVLSKNKKKSTISRAAE